MDSRLSITSKTGRAWFSLAYPEIVKRYDIFWKGAYDIFWENDKIYWKDIAEISPYFGNSGVLPEEYFRKSNLRRFFE